MSASVQAMSHAAAAPADAQTRFEAVLLGTAVGDALGLPAENMSPARIRRRWKGEWRMRLFLGRGMISDDTEHTLLVAQALLEEHKDPAAFQRLLARRLRWWFVALPGGVGFATAKACIRLWLGFSPSRAAVRSAGSGPAMRSGIIGAFFANDPEKRRAFVLASSRLTHTSWQAETAALAVAEVVAAAIFKPHPCLAQHVLPVLRNLSLESEWARYLDEVCAALDENLSVNEFARRSGLVRGVTGYSLHVFFVSLYALLSNHDFRSSMTAALDCGGDTDTVGAVLGAMCASVHGSAAIPRDWLDGICDWPRSINFMREVARQLAEQKRRTTLVGPVRYFWLGVVPRNVLFLTVVILHGLRRLLPPY